VTFAFTLSIYQAVNHINSPAYKLANVLRKILHKILNRPIYIYIYIYIYTTPAPQLLAHNLIKLQHKEKYRLLTLDIKDLYVNIPINEVIPITYTFLCHNKTDQTLQQKTVHTKRNILNQNYFQSNKKFYKPSKGVARDSPLSGTIIRILQTHRFYIMLIPTTIISNSALHSTWILQPIS
jgi:hypothetical protein